MLWGLPCAQQDVQRRPPAHTHQVPIVLTPDVITKHVSRHRHVFLAQLRSIDLQNNKEDAKRRLPGFSLSFVKSNHTFIQQISKAPAVGQALELAMRNPVVDRKDMLTFTRG